MDQDIIRTPEWTFYAQDLKNMTVARKQKCTRKQVSGATR